MATKKTEKPEETIRTTERPEAASGRGVAALESINELALRHRVPTWQLAALLRFTDWADDKRVTEADFLSALEGLSRRPLGGGRR